MLVETELEQKIEIAYSVACLRTLGEILSPFPWAQKSEAALPLLSNHERSLEELKLVDIFPFAFFKPLSWEFSEIKI